MARVYVSSTYSDLIEERREVLLQLRRMGHDDVAMEYYVAGPDRPLAKCLADVENCDLYLAIIAFRYGYIPAGETYSITELEYRRAKETGKPCVIIMVKEDASWPVDRIEFEAHPKVRLFRDVLKQNHIVGFFQSKEDIKVAVAESLQSWETSKATERTIPKTVGTRANRRFDGTSNNLLSMCIVGPSV